MLERLNMLIHPNGKPLYKGYQRVSHFKNKKSNCVTKNNYQMSIENKHYRCEE